ncbi:MAG TPA: UDP-N-acetylmuramoyl-L-alanine--D-glutamate ligase [Allosphingosinicella sp.]|nr:UDP-N-acetylmuramoyl-L-alanine--D-glutamate ligase [Allosphingosinicella sp.]
MDRARSVGIWGYGREGRAALAYLRAHRPDLDLAVLVDGEAPELDDDNRGVPTLSGSAAAEAVAGGRFDLIVKSPGISLRRPEIAAARAAGASFTSATNLWFEANGTAGTIGITGTKGKSTTAALVEAILTAAGKRVRLLGNSGLPALGQAKGEDHTILELSSYQIADLEFAPEIAVVTNLFPEHAPWHGGVEAYYADKLRIAELGPSQIIANYRNEELRRRIGSRSDAIWFNREGGFSAEAGVLTFRGRPVEILGPPPPGLHNLANVAAAATVARQLGLAGITEAVDLRSFRRLPHRMEELELARGITAVDDSIATVPEATAAALQYYDGRPIHLILGGSERGQDYGVLHDVLRRASVRAVYLLPKTGLRIADELAAAIPELAARPSGELETAVRTIAAEATEGSVVLLSPGAPSFDQFTDFTERGRKFQSLCRELIGGPSRAEPAEPSDGR